MKTSSSQVLRRAATTSLAALLAMLAGTRAASAEPTLHGEGVHVGLGAGLSPFGLVLFDNDIVPPAQAGGGLYVPIDIGESLRVEPEVGLFRYSTSRTSDGLEESAAYTSLRFGSGVFYRMALGESSGAYVGGRLGLVLNSETDENYQPDATGNETKTTTTESRTDLSVALAGGGEHFFTPHFSLGAEAQLGMLFQGDETREREPAEEQTGPTVETSGFVLETRSLLFARVYFF